MHDQDADQRCGTDKIKIKQALLLMGGLLLLLQSVLDEPPQLLGYSGRPSGGGLILFKISARAADRVSGSKAAV